MKNALPPLARAHVPTKRAPTGHLTLRRTGAFIGMVRASNIQGGMKRGDGRFMFAAEKTSPQGPSPALVRPPKREPSVRITKAHCTKVTKTYRKIKPKSCHFHCYFIIEMLKWKMCAVLSPKAHLSETRSPSNAILADVKTPLCAGSKTDIMSLTKIAPAVASCTF